MTSESERERKHARQLIEVFDLLFVRREQRRGGHRFSVVEAMVHDAHDRPEEGRLAATKVSFLVAVAVSVAKLLHLREYIHEQQRKRER